MSAKKANEPRPIKDILRDAWRLRDELDAAAIDLSGQALHAGPENVLRTLAPDIYRIYEERGPTAAYDAAHGREET